MFLVGNLDGMDKKNGPNTKEQQNTRPSDSRLVKLAARAALIATLFAGNILYSQNPRQASTVGRKQTTEQVNIKNNNEHQKIIMENIQGILDTYGKKKWLEIIRKHMLLEINIYRELNNIPPLALDPVLNTLAQTFAEYWGPYKQLWHSFDGKWYEDMGIDLSKFSATAENVSYGMDDISSIVKWRYTSPWHKKTMLWLWVSKHSWNTLVFDAVGMWLSWEFFVADFGVSKKTQSIKK